LRRGRNCMSEQKPKHRRPSAAQMDERLVAPIAPEKFVEGVLQTGPHEEEDVPQELIDAGNQEREYPGDDTDEG
jgi:hypothetical protein